MSAKSASLEVQLVAALQAGDATTARALATALHERGFDLAALTKALEAQPHLEESLWDLMSDVIPVSRRAKKRRAVRAAEERDWGDWEEGKQDRR